MGRAERGRHAISVGFRGCALKDLRGGSFFCGELVMGILEFFALLCVFLIVVL